MDNVADKTSHFKKNSMDVGAKKNYPVGSPPEAPYRVETPLKLTRERDIRYIDECLPLED